MGNLFSTKSKSAPLAERMRPQSLNEMVGQPHLIGKGKALRTLIEESELRSLVFWGPPGSGKTTLGWIIAANYKANFVHFSAAVAGTQDIKKSMARSKEKFDSYRDRDLIFIDEIHRFNKAQQDIFLPYVEEGSIILIGATTENPSLELNSPLLSRSRVFTFEPLKIEDIKILLRRTLADEKRGLGASGLKLDTEAEEFIAQISDGDARQALNLLELSFEICEDAQIDLATVKEGAQKKLPRYDKKGEEWYNLISALHKSVRNSDSHASLYWLARMLEGGADPLYIARRLIRAASEDIGLADPTALRVALDAKDAVEAIGMPECNLALAEATLYLATAPKSNSLYKAYKRSKEEVKEKRNPPVPLHLRNAPTKLMREMGYSEGYKYAHNFEGGVADMECLPGKLLGKKYYRPKEIGYEREIKKRLKYWRRMKEKQRGNRG